MFVCWQDLSIWARRGPARPAPDVSSAASGTLTFVSFRADSYEVLRVSWLIPSNFLWLSRTTFTESITSGEWFIGTAGISATPHHHPVYPFLRLIPSINASRQALGYRPSSSLSSCTLMSLHPSSSFSIKGSSMGSSYLFLWICRPLLSDCQSHIGRMLYGAPWPA